MSESAESRAFNWFTPPRFGILLALLVFATFPQVLLGLETFVTRDYGFFAYPLAWFQRDCFRHGELPFWNPYNNCGVPFLAQWNTMPLYPPALIYLLLPLPWSLSFFCLLHLWFAGFGMYRLTRRWTSNDFAAAFAGVAFVFNGFTLNLLTWPSHIATFSWMPWVVLAVEAAWREGRRKIIAAAFVGALQMLAGGPETIFLTWVLLLALWIQQLAKGESSRAAMLWRFPLVVALVAALAAAQLLPFLDLAAHSQRVTGYADLRWSLPAWGLANYLVPMAFGGLRGGGVFFPYNQSWTSSYYLGLGTLWLALLAVWVVRNPRVWLMSIVAIAALLFALGDNTFVYPALRKIIPQFSYVTYPVKYLSLVTFIAPLLAAFALARRQNLNQEQKPAFNRRLILTGTALLVLIAGILFWARQFPFPSDDVRATWLNGWSRVAFLILTGAVLLVFLPGNTPGQRRLGPLVLIFIAWLDAFTHVPDQNPTVPPWVYDPGMARLKLGLQPQPAPGESRAMVSPAAALEHIRFAARDAKNNYLAKRLGYCANCNLLDAVPKVDGFFSLTPRECDDVLSQFYTFPQGGTDYPRLEDFLGVSQLTAPDEFFHWTARKTFLPLVTVGQKPVFLGDTDMLRALIQPDFDGSRIVFLPPEEKSEVTVTSQTEARVLDSKFGTQQVDIAVEASEPSLVVVAQTWYHNWRAEVDGRPAPLLRANHAFQAVQVPAGKHHIRLVYEDRMFQFGALLSLCLVLNCLIVLHLLKKLPPRPES
jgi:hypothetical protein